MAKNHIQPGNAITFTAATDVASGQGVEMGALFGVALTSAATGEQFEAGITGVWQLPKVSGEITAGAKVYWTGTAVTTTATGNRLIGAATETAATAAATAIVRLNGTAV